MHFRVEARATLEVSEGDRETLLRVAEHFTGSGSDVIRLALKSGGCSMNDMVHLNTVTLPQLERIVEAGNAIPEMVTLHSMLRKALGSRVAVDGRSMRILGIMIAEEENSNEEQLDKDSVNGQGDLQGEGPGQALRSDQDRRPAEDS